MSVTDVNMPKIGKELLRKLETKQITMTEFEQETAYWMMDSLNDCRWKSYPPVPEDLMEYYQRRKRDKKYEAGDAFWQQPHVRQYVTANSDIKSQNSANRYWLKYMQLHIPQEDIVNQSKIKVVMNSYPKLEV